MRRVLLVSSPEKGHLHPLVGVAQHLLRLGHRVAWLTLPHPVEELRRLGIEPVGIDVAPRPAPPQALADLVRDPAALRAWVTDLLLGSIDWRPRIEEAIERVEPDVVALDPMQYAAIIAAHRLGIPYAGISSSLNPVTPSEWQCDLTRTVDSLAASRAEVFAHYGLQPVFRICDALSPDLNVVFSTAEYAGSDVPAKTHLVGPSRPLGPRGDEPAFPWAALDASRPLIYVSFGSQIAAQAVAFGKVAEAAEALGAQVVINTGPGFALAAGASLPGVILVPYAPQLALLERTSVIVSHGGANSVMEAHLAGVPMLLSPVCNDQHLQARFLERSGAGRVLDLHSASIDATTEALAALLPRDSAHRMALAPITASYRRTNGAAETAGRIIALGS